MPILEILKSVATDSNQLGTLTEALNRETSLNLSHQELSSIDIINLATVLKDNRSLTSLDLSSINLPKKTPEAIEALMSALEKNNKLTILNLNHNFFIGEKIGITFRRNQFPNIQNTPIPPHPITLCFNKALAKVLEKNQTLTSLNLRATLNCNTSVEAIVDSLQKNNTLRYLTISGIGLQDASSLAIAEAIEKRMAPLHLSFFGNISDTGVMRLAAAVNENPNLTELDVSCGEFRDISSSKEELKKALTRNKIIPLRMAVLKEIKETSLFPAVLTPIIADYVDYKDYLPPEPPEPEPAPICYVSPLSSASLERLKNESIVFHFRLKGYIKNKTMNACGKPVSLHGPLYGLRSDQHAKKQIAIELDKKLLNLSPIYQLAAVRKAIRKNKKATGPQPWPGKLAQILTGMEKVLLKNISPQERALAELKDYRAIAVETNQIKRSTWNNLRSNQTVKLNMAKQVWEAFQDPSKTQEERISLLKDAITRNKRATVKSSPFYYGRLNEIFEDLLRNMETKTSPTP